jgi:hypothetical protein
MTAAIETQALKKVFGQTTAVDAIDLHGRPWLTPAP